MIVSLETKSSTCLFFLNKNFEVQFLVMRINKRRKEFYSHWSKYFLKHLTLFAEIGMFFFTRIDLEYYVSRKNLYLEVLEITKFELRRKIWLVIRNIFFFLKKKNNLFQTTTWTNKISNWSIDLLKRFYDDVFRKTVKAQLARRIADFFNRAKMEDTHNILSMYCCCTKKWRDPVLEYNKTEYKIFDS